MIIGSVFAILFVYSVIMGAWTRPGLADPKHRAVWPLFGLLSLLASIPAMTILTVDWSTGGAAVWQHFDAVHLMLTVDPTFGSAPAATGPKVALPIWFPLTFLIPPLLGFVLGKYVEGQVAKLVVRDPG